MMLWIAFIFLIAATAGFLLYPLMQNRAAVPREKRMQLIGVIVIAVLLPLGAVLLYTWLGSPDLPGKPYVANTSR